MTNSHSGFLVGLTLFVGIPVTGAVAGGTHWEMISRTEQCAETFSPRQCRGYYGFSIHLEGNFQVGPGPEGEMIIGQLEQEELAFLDPLANSVSKYIHSKGMAPGPILAGWSDYETLFLEGGAGYLAYHWNGDGGAIFFLGKQSDAFALHSFIDTMLVKYYPRPFPVSKSRKIPILPHVGDVPRKQYTFY